jgi:hypothetical protein
VQSSLAYFNPGCGAGEKAVITQFDGEQHEDPTDSTTRSRLFIVDAAARALSKPILLNSEFSSPVPVKNGIAAAAGDGLVSVSSTGKVKGLASATGVPFRLVPDSSGGVVFMDKVGDQARVKRAVGKKVTELARGPGDGLSVTRGDAGRAFITGQPSHVAKLPAGVRRIAVPQGSEISTRGELAVTEVKPVGAKDPRTDNVDPTVAKDVTVTAMVTATAKSLAFEVSPDVLGPEAIGGRAAHPKLGEQPGGGRALLRGAPQRCGEPGGPAQAAQRGMGGRPGDRRQAEPSRVASGELEGLRHAGVCTPGSV